MWPNHLLQLARCNEDIKKKSLSRLQKVTGGTLATLKENVKPAFWYLDAPTCLRHQAALVVKSPDFPTAISAAEHPPPESYRGSCQALET